MLKAPPEDVNGQCFLDEDFLRDHEKVEDFGQYYCVPGASPRRNIPAVVPDLRVVEHDDEGTRMDSTLLERKAKL
jgi:hypothetical protein